MKNNILPFSLVVALSVFVLSCKKESGAVRRASEVTVAEIEGMVTVAGQEFSDTIGAQGANGPYESLGSSSGSFGASFNFEGLTFKVPKNGREYIARRFRNPDGSPFMKISRYPEGSGKPK